MARLRMIKRLATPDSHQAVTQENSPETSGRGGPVFATHSNLARARRTAEGGGDFRQTRAEWQAETFAFSGDIRAYPRFPASCRLQRQRFT